MLTVNGLPKPKKNLEAFVDAGTVSKNVTFAKGSGTVVNGRNIVKAGSVITGFLGTYNAFGTVSTLNTDAEGILLVDVDTTDKAASGAVMITGWINTDKLDAPIDAAAQTALTKIGFIANGK